VPAMKRNKPQEINNHPTQLTTTNKFEPCATQKPRAILDTRPPLWSSGQSFWLQIPRSWVRSPALPYFLRSRGSETGSTKPREDNWGATWMKK
jgi:hypothetical protein